MRGYTGRSRDFRKENVLFQGSRPEPVLNNNNETLNNINNDIYGKKSQKKRLFSFLTHSFNYVKEYCHYSSVHGFRYLSERGRSWFERVFWVTAIAICAIGCSRMIFKIKAKMESTPVIVTLSDNPTNIWNVPFPAVTVCPETKSRHTVFNFTKYTDFALKNKEFPQRFLSWVDQDISEDNETSNSSNFLNISAFKEIGEMLKNSTLCESIYEKMWAVHILCDILNIQNYAADGNRTLDEDAIEFLLEVAPKMNNGDKVLNNYMMYAGGMEPFDQNFRHSWTTFGLCFTYNMLDDIYIYNDQVINNHIFKKKGLDKNFPKFSMDWDLDKGYWKTSNPDTYPQRCPFKKEENTLRILMMENKNDTDECMGGRGNLGFNIILHQVQDHPQPSLHNVVRMPFFKLTELSLKLDVMTTSPELEHYDPHKRQCYHSYEKPLKYFKVYSQHNCEFECLTNATLKRCGCVQFYMPRFNETKVCGANAHYCVMDAAFEANKGDFDAALKYLSESGKSPLESALTKTECDCLPSCLAISYEADFVATKDLELNTIFYLDFLPPDSEQNVALSGVDIIFKKTFFIASRRSELYGQIDFLANCGGLLGLFCGFSIISLIEVIYFLTIRVWTNIYRKFSSRRQGVVVIQARPRTRRVPALRGGLIPGRTAWTNSKIGAISLVAVQGADDHAGKIFWNSSETSSKRKLGVETTRRTNGFSPFHY